MNQLLVKYLAVLAAVLHLSQCLVAAEVRISFLQDRATLKDTVQLLKTSGCAPDGIALFTNSVHQYFDSEFTLDLRKFPAPKDGFYTFLTPHHLTAALPHPLYRTEHPYEINCFDVMIALASRELKTSLRPDDVFGPFMISKPTTNGTFESWIASTAQDAFGELYLLEYQSTTAHLFSPSLQGARISLTPSFFRNYLLPGSTDTNRPAADALKTMRQLWSYQKLQFPKSFEVVLFHQLNLPTRFMATTHTGILLRRGKAYSYLEKAGGSGPFVRIDVDEREDLRPWFSMMWQDSEDTFSHLFVTYNDTSIETLRLPTPTPLSRFREDPEAISETEHVDGWRGGEENSVTGIDLRWCPPGRFLMGSPPNEPERRPGETQVEVTFTNGFWIGATEVTQEQWRDVVGEFPGKLTAGRGNSFPMYDVTFAEAEEFCRLLTQEAHESNKLPKNWEFRLPTEAQWEYACRAETTTATSFGAKLSSKQANFQGKPYNGAEPGPSLKRTTQVASYPANPWGIYDMHGNVFEWCRDWYHLKLPGGVDPDLHLAKDTATRSEHGDISRVRRGGCWADDGWACRSAFRLRFEPERRHDHIGFRVVAVRR